MFITGDAVIDTIIIVVVLIVVIAIVRNQLQKRRGPTSSSLAWEPTLSEVDEDDLPESHRYGWVQEHPAVLLQSTDTALRSTIKAALEARQKGNQAEAVRLFRACFVRSQNTAEEQAALLILIGNCFLVQGRLESAAGHFREAAELIQHELASA